MLQDQQTEVKKSDIWYGIKTGDGGDADPEPSLKPMTDADEGSATEDEDVKPGAKSNQSKDPSPKPKKACIRSHAAASNSLLAGSILSGRSQSPPHNWLVHRYGPAICYSLP